MKPFRNGAGSDENEQRRTDRQPLPHFRAEERDDWMMSAARSESSPSACTVLSHEKRFAPKSNAMDMSVPIRTEEKTSQSDETKRPICRAGREVRPQAASMHLGVPLWPSCIREKAVACNHSERKSTAALCRPSLVHQSHACPLSFMPRK